MILADLAREDDVSEAAPSAAAASSRSVSLRLASLQERSAEHRRQEVARDRRPSSNPEWEDPSGAFSASSSLHRATEEDARAVLEADRRRAEKAAEEGERGHRDFSYYEEVSKRNVIFPHDISSFDVVKKSSKICIYLSKI